MTNPPPARRVVVLASGTGSILRAVIEAAREEAFGARVVGVVTDKDDAGALAIAREAGIPTAVVRLEDFESRALWDEAVARTLATFDPELVLLAGFMRLLGAPVLDRFGGRIVNTHPALLPAYPGAHGVRDALAGGAKVTGCSVILVDAGVDTGPIVAQAAVEVLDDDTESTLHARIKEVEQVLVARTIGRMAREGWTVTGRSVRFGAPTPTPEEES
ncbi:phosphoribosylglycinamide formyltransferase [Demequina gelatinilytica]|uniref:phosphoribosylglycinamide formyltransferase n=1 Tax=Demequina gelatinilytica TaxID=1638980 RepID=UPI0007848394|nr:phosphoribosylglycinamide formyltransferase [Demequina gelatinilytica]